MLNFQTLNKIAMADDKMKRGMKSRIKVISSDNYEVRYFKDKMGITHQAVTGAMRATGSNDRKSLAKYLRNKQK